MPARPGYYPETVVFVLDVCEDPGIDYAKHAARLELLKQCIGHCALAKSRVNPSHKFGLAVIRDSVQWAGAGVTASPEGLLAALRGVQPYYAPHPSHPSQPAAAAAAAPPPPHPTALGPSSSCFGGAAPPPLDLGDIVSLVQPLAVAEEADGCGVRVVLVYCRSTVVPTWASRHRPGEALGMDLLLCHDKTAAAAVAAAWPDCPTPQDVFTWLEENVDELSGRCGHHAYIFEAGGHLVRKVTNMLISLVAHPAQRPPQRALRLSPLDLAAMPPHPTAATAAATAAAAAGAAGVLDSSAFPPLSAAASAAAAAAAVPRGPAAAPVAAAAPAGSAWGVPAPAPAARSYSPSGLVVAAAAAPSLPQVARPPPPPQAAAAVDLIDLASPSESAPAPPLPPPAAAATTAPGAPGFPPMSHPAPGMPLPLMMAVGGSPVRPYMPPGLVPPTAGAAGGGGGVPAAAAATAAASQGLAGLTLAQPPPLPAAAAAVDAWAAPLAAEHTSWSHMPPPPAADPSPF